MGLVIDTNFFIDIENKRLEIEKLNDFSSYGDAYIASVTASELLAGIHLSKNISIKLTRTAFVENILEQIPILNFDERVARTYAEIYAYFLKPRSKSSSNVHDLQIAATALAHGYSLLTSNIEDFEKIPGIKILTI
ncbi:tRNA(fMet)-specific endonuclease VapC [Legionella nautarum]|uniref:tRNA(FMet)-specific endonuclease VapC n=1 Tax=Legionella nautarum TaxID=45070 RepID=A0A0W0WUH2_9GAMM|nr:type II toxin-antitoxin system VapC family toxin [Legionella nautarum]KTD35960.1 tRNA(fMet)-specific endonuclease VapC [Legionella nautarum]